MSYRKSSNNQALNQSSNNAHNNDIVGAQQLERSSILHPNAFLSEGNYRWGGGTTSDEHQRQNREQQQQQQQHGEQQHQQQTRCDFEWLSVRLLEKITFIVSITRKRM